MNLKTPEQQFQLNRRLHVNTPPANYDEKLAAKLAHWSLLLGDEEWYYQNVASDELVEAWDR